MTACLAFAVAATNVHGRAAIAAAAPEDADADASASTVPEISPALATIDVVAPMSSDLVDGTITVRRFTLAGLPVRGAFEVVHTSTDGVARVVASRRPIASATVTPVIDGARAAAIAVATLPTSAGRSVEPERPPELVHRMILGVPVLAWELQLPLVTKPEPSRKTIWISATTGEVLDERENVFAARARVYAENPVVTPDPIEVELTDLDPMGAGEPLAGARVRSFNCTMEEPAVPQPWHDDGDCWAVARTLSDADGNYFVPVPDPIDPASGVDGDDLYAELSMYAHAERFLNVMAEHGITAYRCEVSTMLANFRTVSEDDPSVVVPLDNAYYTDQCDPERGPTMLFGQGTAVDFAFDGDVVHHELGHGIVALLTPDGLSASRPRADAVLADAGGINEAIADYVTVILQDDPLLAEYVGTFWPEMPTPYIRAATNDMRCPEDTIGQFHNDGEPLMAALWAARVELGRALDPVVLASLARLPEDASLEDASAALLAVAGEREQAGQLATGGTALLERALVARGLVECLRVITDPELVTEGRTMYLRKKSATVEPFWPGPMQLRYQLPDDARAITVALDLRARGSEEPATVAVLVKRSALPIAFTYDLVARDDAGDPTGSVDKVREKTLVGGDWDLVVPAVRVAGRTHEVRIEGLLPGETVHLALAATAGVDAVAELVRVVDARDHGEGSSSSAGEESAGGDPRDDVRPGDAVASCGCTDAPRGGPWWAAVAMMLARRRRRR